jgi:acyl-CoA reductase-like NAD-dependent aldehyde dehydrogenase
MREKTIQFEKPGAEATEEKIEGARSARLNVLKTYKIYIDGKFPRTESGRYFVLKSSKGDELANVNWSSRKDFRDAVSAARAAHPKWAKMTAYNRGQILYRIAEILESRRSQFVEELALQGSSVEAAQSEVETAIDRLVYYAGWADKFQQVFSSVNPVASSHFNFSMLEATGVVSILSAQDSGLLGLVTALAVTIVSGNTCVALASSEKPLSAVTFAEVLHASDVPAGVVNILTGYRKELITHFASHMDVNATLACGISDEDFASIQTQAVANLKRVIKWNPKNWYASECEDPYRILDFTEVKTTWHPIGN